MKFILKHLHHAPSRSLAKLIRERIAQLRPSLQIDEAHVTVERRREMSPPFRVQAHLVTPGPDVFGEATDHTLRAALHKTITRLAERIAHRHEKRAQRKRDRGQDCFRLGTPGARS